MDRLAHLLPRFVRRELGADLPFRLVMLWRCWDEVVGPEVAAVCRPLGRRKTVLRVGVEDAMAMQEVTFLAPQILEATHDFLGEPLFDAVQGELLRGRPGLDEVGVATPSKRAPTRPTRLGETRHRFEEDADEGGGELAKIVAESYRKYLAFFDQ